MNRRTDGTENLKVEDLEEKSFEIMDMYEHLDDSEFYKKEVEKRSNKTNKASDKVTRIYGCATMWHENIEEMMEMLKSIFRIDKDYSARRLAQKYMSYVDPDFYEWETHILFDDAFMLGNDFVNINVEM